jgi:uncharacterized membrane protein YoaT (DUF817 family)
MTDHESADQPEVAEAASGIGSELSSTVAKLGAGEKLAVLGAAGVLAVWLVFDLLIDEYRTGDTMFVLALVVVAAAYKHHNGGSEGWSIDYRTLVIVGGALLGILGGYYVIEEVRADIFDADGATIVGALVFYAASITSGVGAWQMSRG